ncbi:MAG TPA: AMP-binding protein [Gemmatimonadaceae bacterium]|nr:AMP-binding protein [Gemmatimonadaceae bacterium]
MSNPLGVLPLAIAARGGMLDGMPAAQLVAAGLTLLQRSAVIARALYGRRAALLLPTGPQFLVGLAASEGRGAVLLNPLATPAELAYQLHDSNVGAVFTLASLAHKLPATMLTVLLDDAPRQAAVMHEGAIATIDLGSHVGLELEGEDDVAGIDEEAAIVYTSAMDGHPLGAILTHRSLLSNGWATVSATATTPADHMLALLPFSHLFGMTVTMTAPLLAGARVTTMGRFNPMKAVDVLVEDGVTMLVGVPAVFIGVLAAIERRGGTIDVPALRVCISGGAALPVWVQRKWESATGCPLRQGYGLTEASPVCLFNRVDAPNRIGSLGTAYPDAEVSIRNPTTSAELATGASGEICVRGPLVGPGYVSGGERGLRRVDGWLHSGDQGSMDADGHVAFEGLIKPMFTRNGFNIYPAELVRVVGGMPGVTRVEVAAVPEPSKEHEIEIVVHGAVDEALVRQWCETHLSTYKQPSRITIVA